MYWFLVDKVVFKHTIPAHIKLLLYKDDLYCSAIFYDTIDDMMSDFHDLVMLTEKKELKVLFYKGDRFIIDGKDQYKAFVKRGCKKEPNSPQGCLSWLNLVHLCQ